MVAGLPGMPVGSRSTAVAHCGWAFLDVPQPGNADQRPGRSGYNHGLVARGLVVRLAKLGMEAAALAVGTRRFALVSAPWFVVMSIASRGEFLRFAVGRQIIHRLASDMEAHGGFPGYYPIVSILAFYPWSALVPAGFSVPGSAASPIRIWAFCSVG